MNKTATILLTLLFVTPLFAINASASNESGEQTYEDFVIEYHPLPTNAVVMDQEEFEYKEQICGYRDTNNDGISDLRGNCESSSFIAPNDRWFQYQIPLSADGSWPGFGDYVRFYVDNNGEPNNVDVEVWLCWEPTDNRGTVMCSYEDNIYSDEYERA